MRFGLRSSKVHDYANAVAAVKSDAYYVKMMIAWYFATGLSENFQFFSSFLTENKLSKWIHNKTIQKGVESYRISAEQKDFLKKLRR